MVWLPATSDKLVCIALSRLLRQYTHTHIHADYSDSASFSLSSTQSQCINTTLRAMNCLRLFYTLSFFSLHYWLPKRKNPIIWCQRVQTISEVSLSTEIRQQVISRTNRFTLSTGSHSFVTLHTFDGIAFFLYVYVYVCFCLSVCTPHAFNESRWKIAVAELLLPLILLYTDIFPLFV